MSQFQKKRLKLGPYYERERSEVATTTKRRRGRRKPEGDESGVDEKPIVIDLANAKWMVK